MDLHTLMSAYAEGGSPRGDSPLGPVGRHRADAPVAEKVDLRPHETEPRHRADPAGWSGALLGA